MTKRRSIYQNLSIIMVIVSLCPLIVIGSLLINQYEYILEKETEQQLRWNTEIAKYNIENYLQNLIFILKFATKEYTIEGLKDRNKVENLYSIIKRDYKGFVDLSIIDSTGLQIIYIGPFLLENKDYSTTEWFNKAKIRNEYISSFIYGYRNIPHFVLTITKYSQDYKDFILIRTSIDIKTLEEVLGAVSTIACDDIFLVDNDSTLHTFSHFFGRVDQKISLPLFTHTSILVTNKIKLNDVDIIYSVVPIHDTPWRLVLIKKGHITSNYWANLKEELVFTVFISSIIVFLLSLFIGEKIKKKLIEMEESKETALLAAQHAGKLASIGRLASGVAHEINNPLAIIDQKAGLLEDILELTENFEYKEKFAQELKSIKDAVQRCKSITHRLLGFARRLDVTLTELDLPSLIDEVISFVKNEALFKHIRITTIYADDLPKVQGDKGQLQQVFLNLLNNAIDAIGKDGEIIISAKKKDDKFVEVSVSDTGTGIPPHILKHIFEPFFTTKEPGKGTGLGLSITYGIIKKFGGDIQVESTVGKGTTFYITIPIRVETSHEL